MGSPSEELKMYIASRNFINIQAADMSFHDPNRTDTTDRYLAVKRGFFTSVQASERYRLWSAAD